MKKRNLTVFSPGAELAIGALDDLKHLFQALATSTTGVWVGRQDHAGTHDECLARLRIRRLAADHTACRRNEQQRARQRTDAHEDAERWLRIERRHSLSPATRCTP
jgi:hypothetical protein